MSRKTKSVKAWAIKSYLDVYTVYVGFRKGYVEQCHPYEEIVRVLITEQPKKRRKK